MNNTFIAKYGTPKSILQTELIMGLRKIKDKEKQNDFLFSQIRWHNFIGIIKQMKIINDEINKIKAQCRVIHNKLKKLE